jgi:hypothetical protein
MKTHQNVQSRKRNQTKQEMGHVPKEYEAQTNEDEAQDHSATAPAKAVRGGAT